MDSLSRSWKTFTKSVTLLLIFIWSFLCWSQLDADYRFSVHQSSSYNEQSTLEVLLADQLLERSEQVSRNQLITDFQKKQFIRDVRNALQLYIKILNKISDREEKSKVYFRMGYLYEMLNLKTEAIQTYKKVTEWSHNFNRVKQARQRIKVLQKKSNALALSSLKPVDTHPSEYDKKTKTIVKLDQDLLKVQEYVHSRQWDKAIDSFKKVCHHYAFNYPCYLEGCSEFSSSLRYFIKWVRDQSYASSKLHDFYHVYLSFFPRDLLVSLSAAQYAFRQGKHDQSMKFYQRYILFEKKYIHQHLQKNEEKEEKQKDLESVFYVNQRMAHLSKKSSLQIQAYDFYLTHSESRSLVPKVLYLKNVVLFQEKEYAKVAPLFRQITMAQDTENHIREKAARYAIQSLLNMNQKVAAQKWAEQLSHFVPRQSLQSLLSGS